VQLLLVIVQCKLAARYGLVGRGAVARSGQHGAVLRSPASVQRPRNARAVFATAFLGRRLVSNASTRRRHSASGSDAAQRCY
jgi:hypothetical protein